MKKTLPSRQVHLDFHTSPAIRDVAVDFDAGEFARTFQDARVNSVTVFAKCHHGHLYFAIDRPERHPGLKSGCDLLREQIGALHEVGIRAPVYISVQCDEFAANIHPEWLARDELGRPVRRGRAPGWQILDMSSPYQEYLVELVELILREFDPVDGIFFDMCWDQPSAGEFAAEKMRQAGLNPSSPADRDLHARHVAIDYMRRLHAMVKRANPAASVYFNSRPLHNLPDEVEFLEQIEIESLPTGGWGYMYFPTHVRFARQFARPYLGMTARFHKSWGDFGSLKPPAALQYETAQMIAHGAGCSIGDQLHPRGRLDPAVYALIGQVYGRIERCEPWLDGATPVTQVGLIQTQSTSDEGATRLLTQLRQQFDVVSADMDLSRFDLVVLPDCVRVSAALGAKLRRFLDAGGAVLATGTGGLADNGSHAVLNELGLICSGFSPFSTVYMRLGRRIDRDVAATEHVIYEPTVRVAPDVGAISLATIVEPYFERSDERFCSHAQTPPDKPTKYSAAVLHGRTAYVAFNVFEAFARHGYPLYRVLVRNILDLLLPEPLLRVSGPTGLESTVMWQDSRTIVHLIWCPAERRAPGLDLIEDVVPLHDIDVSVRLDQPTQRVYLAPEMTEVNFNHSAGRTTVRLPQLRGHAMVVFE